MIAILVVEDNPFELKYCCDAIRSISQEHVILEAADAKEALVLMQRQRIDVFFLDVELPDTSGFQLAEHIRGMPDYAMTTIIFVTGLPVNHLEIHRKYHHYEYIEKPYTFENFKDLMEPLFKRLDYHRKREGGRQIEKRKRMVALQTNKGTRVIAVSDILYAEVTGRRLILHMKQEISIEVRQKMASLIKAVNSSSFLQCHRSFAVNVNNVLVIEKVGRRQWHAYFSEKKETFCRISETHYEEIYRNYIKRVKC